MLDSVSLQCNIVKATGSSPSKRFFLHAKHSRSRPYPASSGVGKTTLLNHVPNNRHALKVVVIVNDISEVTIDVDLVPRTRSPRSSWRA